MTSAVDVSCPWGVSWASSSSATGGEESCDIDEGSGGRKSRGRMLRVDNGGNTSSGRTKEVVEGERIVISMVESLCGGGGASG